ncbi:MAG TPA: polyprenyl synthetase family protein [Candidatus Limnocylindrales bacterium]|nr:polyprenyl synthetase family protein [Candidatus Limnocylindrales bacterium]
MEKKTLSKKLRKKKLLPQALKILEAQGSESLENARKRLLAIGVEDPKARESLKMYASNWNDFIHPAILSLSSDSVSEKTPFITDLQVMVLLLTAAMDIHDDVMDKSQTKNGKTTLYGKFGGDLAILVGDAILMESLMMLNSFKDSLEPGLYDRIVASMKNFLLEVGNAHLMELQLKRRVNVSPQELTNLIERKASIFEGMAEIGAIAAKGSNDQIKALKAFARAFGYLVMVREEFIDMFEPAELSNRLKNEYPPLPVLCAVEDPKVQEHLMTLVNGKISKKSAQELVDLVYENQNVIKLKETLEDRASRTIQMLMSENLRKKPRLSLALIIKTTLEEL